MKGMQEVSCPNCGAKGKLGEEFKINEEMKDPDGVIIYYRVTCNKCGIEGGAYAEGYHDWRVGEDTWK